jgi:site-specific DNA recombinase
MRITKAPIAEARILLEQLALQVSVTSKGASASFDVAVLGSIAGLTDIPEKRISIAIPTSQSSYGHEPRLRLEPAGSGSISRDERLFELIARAFSAREQLLGLDQHQLDALPVTKLRHLQRTARVSYLDPAIIRAILNGTQPSRLSARSVWRMSDLPLDWADQRQALGITTIQP